MNKNLFSFFNPQSIAIIGASEQSESVGAVITNNILNFGYSGKVFLVNSKRKIIYGKNCFSEISEIPQQRIDLAIIVIPAVFVNEVVKKASNKTKNFVIISAGFGEINSREGKKREQELQKIVKKGNLNILGPNCLGFISPKIKLNASFAGGLPKTGNISFISQSGALAVAFMDMAKKENIGFSNIISIGNKMQLDESSLLEYLGNDENTKVIGLYLESVKNGQKFLKIASVVAQKKPIIILKAGKSEQAQKAISSHTGVLAGSDAVIDELFKKSGVIRVKTLLEFFDTLRLISFSIAPLNNQSVIVTNAGGIGVLITDVLQKKEIILSKFSKKIKNYLKKFLPKESSVENPVDLLGDACEDRYRETLKILSKEDIDIYICALTPQDQTPINAIVEVIIDFKKRNLNKIVITIFVGGEKVETARKKLENEGIICFKYPERAIQALNNYTRWIEVKKNISTFTKKSKKTFFLLSRRKKAQKIIETVTRENRKVLFFKEAEKIMKLYKIKTVKTYKGSEINEKKIIFPVAIKIDSDKILHKTDKKGVSLNIKNKTELLLEIKKMKKRFPRENIIIQTMQKIQTELILGIKYDLTVGPVVLIGLGGIFAEVFKVTELFIPLLSRAEIEKKITESRLSFLFKETRGQNHYNLSEIVDIVEKLALLALEINEIKELDINPLFIYNNNKKALVADVKIILK